MMRSGSAGPLTHGTSGRLNAVKAWIEGVVKSNSLALSGDFILTAHMHFCHRKWERTKAKNSGIRIHN